MKSTGALMDARMDAADALAGEGLDGLAGARVDDLAADLGAAAPLDRARLGRIVGELAADPDRWRGPVCFDAGRRWFRRLELADDYEVWLLSWLPGQDTGFHDHGRAAGAFAVAQGRVSERTVAGSGRVRQRAYAAGRVRSFGSRHVHDVVNDFAGPAVTVHAYSPPLTAMRRYELTQSGLVHIATDRAERDW
jgi:predicted metal-dependent enzyme (double-stranded beta helix superfamily)